MHHLRIGVAREWDEFPEQAEGAALALPFDASANRDERTVRLRHRDVKQSWCVQANGQEIACLPPDEADTISYLAIPPGTLRDGGNELRISGRGAGPDDVLIGEMTVIDRLRAEVMTEATVDVSVREEPGGAAVPSRITVADKHGALISLGDVTDATHAVRPGVVYSATGAARLQLPAGRYVIYAGRGFEYGVDRVACGSGEGRDRVAPADHPPRGGHPRLGGDGYARAHGHVRAPWRRDHRRADAHPRRRGNRAAGFEDREGWALRANAMEVVDSGAVLRDGLALPRD